MHDNGISYNSVNYTRSAISKFHHCYNHVSAWSDKTVHYPGGHYPQHLLQLPGINTGLWLVHPGQGCPPAHLELYTVYWSLGQSQVCIWHGLRASSLARDAGISLPSPDWWSKIIHSKFISPVENDKSFKHFCEYQGEPGGKEQGDYNLPHNPRHHGYDPDEPKNDQASKCVRSKVMLLKLQIILRTSLSVSTFYIYTCDYLHVLDKKNVALGETVKFKLKSQQYL